MFLAFSCHLKDGNRDFWDSVYSLRRVDYVYRICSLLFTQHVLFLVWYKSEINRKWKIVICFYYEFFVIKRNGNYAETPLLSFVVVVDLLLAHCRLQQIETVEFEH